jgi:hypothetical protein
MQGEVNDLVENHKVAESVHFPTATFGYELVLGAAYDAHLEDGKITVTLPKEVAQNWAGSNELGLDHVLELGDDKQLRLLIEKDLKCLTDRPHEDESDAFPNPNTIC